MNKNKFEQANKLIKIGEKQKAYQLFLEETKNNPNDVTSWIGLSSCEPTTLKVVEDLLIAINLQPHNREAWQTLRINLVLAINSIENNNEKAIYFQNILEWAISEPTKKSLFPIDFNPRDINPILSSILFTGDLDKSREENIILMLVNLEWKIW